MLLPSYNTGAQYPGKIYGWDFTGNPLSGFPIATNGHLRGRLTLGDLDHNGNLEIVAGVESFDPGIGASIFIYRPDGMLYPDWPQTTACLRSDTYCGVASIILTDIDKDSTLK